MKILGIGNAIVDVICKVSENFLTQVHEGVKLIEVDYAATGFMLIKISAIKRLIKEKPELKYRNDVDGYLSWGDNFYDFSTLLQRVTQFF